MADSVLQSVKMENLRLDLEKNLTSADDFFEELVIFFSPFMEKADAGNEFEWSSLHRAVGYFLPYLSQEELSAIFIEFMFSLFEDYRCTNINAIDSALQQYIESRLDGDIQDIIVNWPIVCLGHFYNESSCTLRNLLRARYDNQLLCWSIDPLMKAFCFQDFHSVQRLLRYGLPFFLPYLNGCEYTYAYHVMIGALGGDVENYPETLSIEQLPAIIKDKYRTTASQRRLLMVLRGIDVGAQKSGENEQYENSVKNLKLLFSTIPQPLVTTKEIAKFLNYVLQGESKAKDIEDICNAFKQEFPKSGDPLQPRTLQHLSRCEVRQKLREDRLLPHGVWKLDIPKTLKNYILLQENETEFHPNYEYDRSSEKKFLILRS